MDLTFLSTDGVHIERLDWAGAMGRVSRPWSAIVSDLELNPSLHPCWLDVSARSFGTKTEVFILRDDDLDVVGAVPFRHGIEWIRGLKLRVLSIGSNFVSYHSELACRTAPTHLLSGLLKHLWGVWDVVKMNNVPYPSDTVDAFNSVSREEGWRLVDSPGEQSPYITIDSDWHRYLERKGKKFRANVNRSIKRIRTTDTVWYEGACDHKQLLKDILVIEDKSWKKQQGVAISDRPYEHEYHRKLLPYLAGSGLLMANVHYVNEEPIGYALCCRTPQWTGQLKTSFDVRSKDVGAAAITASVRRAFEYGTKVYDFLGDADPHKVRWSDGIRDHRSLTLYASTPMARLSGWIHTRARSFGQQQAEGPVSQLKRSQASTFFAPILLNGAPW